MTTYSKRFVFCVFLSVSVHLFLLYCFSGVLSTLPGVTGLAEQNLVVELVEPERSEKPRKLVEITEPSEEAPESTDNIAEQNSVASAPAAKKEGDKPGPPVEEISEFDTPGSENSKIRVSKDFSNLDTKITGVVKENQRGTEVPKRERGGKLNGEERLVAAVPGKDKNREILESKRSEESVLDELGEVKGTMEFGRSKEDKEDVEEGKEDKLLARVSPKSVPGAKSQGRVYNQVKKEGILGYEAIQDQLAPYLRGIQKQVERYWLHFLLTRYSGTQPTEVVIDCEIDENGKLVKAEVVGMVEDPFYASICKLALERASPFPPFPFKVPDIYQSKTLQIRWTFSFM